jgi:DNA-binding transcriptional ArsR family regulator
MAREQALVETLKACSDPTRAEVLRLLARDSFGVLELAHILELPQPALSHHLKVLARAGLVATRRDGNSIFYRRSARTDDDLLEPLTSSVFAALDHLPLARAKATRLRQVHRQRAQRSRAFFSEHATDFEAQRALICEPEVYLGAVEHRLPRRRRRALDVGPGGGEALVMLTRHFERVVGIDNSKAMLERARRTVSAAREGAPRTRTGRVPRVQLEHGDFLALHDARFDLIVFAMVLHHAPSPAAFFAHAARLLEANGRLIVVELVRHDQEWAREACGDLWLGFEPDELGDWGRSARLEGAAPEFLAQRNGFRVQIHHFDHRSG